MTEKKQRKQNTPQSRKIYLSSDPKYNEREHRKLCPECLDKGTEIQMKKTSTQYTLNQKRNTVNAGLVCIECFHFEPNKDELKKIPK